MEIGLSLQVPGDASPVKLRFLRKFTAAGHFNPRGHRTLHAHGSFGRGAAASPAATALHTALLVLSLESSLQTVWVTEPSALQAINRESFAFAIRATTEMAEADQVDAWLRLDDPRDKVGQQFEELATRWRAETGHLSSMTRKIEHPAYQSIIALGRSALPYLIEEARKGRGHWYAALHTITGEDPVPPDHRGKIKQIASDWVQWAERHAIVRP